MSKTKGNKKRNSSKVKYILGSGVLILASTVILPKVLKKTTNYLYKKQVKITNHRKLLIARTNWLKNLNIKR